MSQHWLIKKPHFAAFLSLKFTQVKTIHQLVGSEQFTFQAAKPVLSGMAVCIPSSCGQSQARNR
ncbi:MAG: hypothetical protein P4L95_09705, partial [Rouxiella aceris]|uniref:hypothetical protein n=1 Tax=Rouxiella aceris TaxID=2703884 RepID=UPI00284C0A76